MGRTEDNSDVVVPPNALKEAGAAMKRGRVCLHTGSVHRGRQGSRFSVKYYLRFEVEGGKTDHTSLRRRKEQALVKGRRKIDVEELTS